MRFPLPLLLLLLAPMPALAYTFMDTVNQIGGALPSLFVPASCDAAGGSCAFITLAEGIIVRFRPLLTVVAGLVISIFGMRMLIAQDDEALDKSRTVMTALISGLVLVYLVEPFVAAFYGNHGEVFTDPNNAAGGAGIVSQEVAGLINWALGIAATLAVFMIVLSSFKAIFSPTSEDSVGKIRKTIFSVAAGLILLVLREVIAVNFVGNTRSPVPLLAIAVRVVSYGLSFLGMISLALVIYAGLQMIFAMGNEERFTKSRAFLIRMIIGAVVIAVSLSLVNFVVLPGIS